jgi:hypothetical protein
MIVQSDINDVRCGGSSPWVDSRMRRKEKWTHSISENEIPGVANLAVLLAVISSGLANTERTPGLVSE